MGLDANGFKKKNYSDIYDEMEVKARELFGDDINTSERSPLGILIRLFAWFHSKGWELAEKVYNSAFVSKAEGVQLDYLTPLYNTKRNPEQAAVVSLAFTGTPNFTILEGTQFTTENDVYFVLTQDVKLSTSGTGTGSAVALFAGPAGNVLANTITIQAEPSADVLTVTNPLGATEGRDIETDLELVGRLLDSTAGNGYGTTNAIRAAILEVPNVRAVSVIENNENTAVGGNDPKSIHAYVLGGDAQAIAEAIYEKKAGGIKPMGAQVRTVYDASGNPQTVRFDYATQVSIYVEVDITTNAGFPINGITLVKDEIVRLIGGTASDGTIYVGSQMGEDVIVSQLTRAVFNITGIDDAKVRVGTSAASLGTANLVIADNQVAQTDTAKVSVI
ncbi:baseplate J/gp47 family protein [Exiguobacterium sp. s127]|uniref:baseplate J/gp47 family protein n=1 Tax=Exiguobacterium sp. s127 TaxID=2751210 RepID=UPI001BE723CF|nr:baseplate J/gp47 family protein [Exiguobacterium sp. s127]